MAGFMTKLRDDAGEGRGIAARAEEFLILTLVRENEVCCAKWGNFTSIQGAIPRLRYG